MNAIDKYIIKYIVNLHYKVVFFRSVIQNQKKQELARFKASQAKTAQEYDLSRMDDPIEQRLIKKISNVGAGALDENQLEEVRY